MAYGDYNNNDKNKIQEREMYTRVACFNPDSTVDPSMFSISYLFGMMKLKVIPKDANSSGDHPKYDKDNACEVFINWKVAIMLSQEIKLFLENPTTYKNVGVYSKPVDGVLISISNGTEFGITSPCLVIRKHEGNSLIFTYVYEFDGSMFSVRNFNQETFEYDKVSNAFVEVIMFKNALDEYVKGITCGAAYGIQDANRYSDNYKDNQIKAIASAVGAGSDNKGSNRGGTRGRNVNTQGGNGGSQSSYETDSDDMDTDDLTDLL